tara:strand:+ start:16770 stop:17516 length:747 start_codon:yes stop_codon:yes gene_type:complete
MKISYCILLIILGLMGSPNLICQEISSKSEKSFSKIRVKPNNVLNSSLMNNFGKKYHAKVSFPDSREKKNSLIIALHWAGNTNTYKEFHDCLITKGFQELNAILISPESEGQLWNTKNNIDKIKSIVDNAVKFWNVDSKRVAITGYSNGGNGSWYFAEHYPELFTAAIPMASLYSLNSKIEIPVYAIHGLKDELFQVSKTEKYINKSIEKGSNITFIINEQLSHFQACAYTQDLKIASRWLKNIWKIK